MPLSSTPRLTKGALVGLDVSNPIASVIIFQYNPEQLSRTLQAQMADTEGGDRQEALRLKGAPIENIKLQVDIDATDQLEQNNIQTALTGIYPQLAALEMLIYPKSRQVIRNTALLASGTLEVLPTMAPLTFLIWGLKRVLPVKVSDFSIAEEAYDNDLNPIRAKVDLGLRVLTYDDLSISNPAYYVYMANQVYKESLAVISSTQVGSLLAQVRSLF